LRNLFRRHLAFIRINRVFFCLWVCTEEVEIGTWATQDDDRDEDDDDDDDGDELPVCVAH